ncbi:MAG: DUF1934 domain-containing protein [Clostridia bacterium]|nr:DUF1934 domain-containing protein [Clostridia bacterium]MBQ4638446.1 DUF1934 domain-containing protein [Clostridia bacterium]
MEKKAKFYIKAVQSDNQGVSTDLELYTNGTINVDGDDFMITYAESEDSGLNGQITKLKGDKKGIEMSRDGEVSVDMRFEEGKSFATKYNTPYGAIELTVIGSKVEKNLNEQGGTLVLEYILDFVGAESFMHKMYLEAKVQN